MIYTTLSISSFALAKISSTLLPYISRPSALIKTTSLMTDGLKLDVIQMLIDKGCDVNWLNYQRETALLIALERIEIDIANLLLDNGAVIYKE